MHRSPNYLHVMMATNEDWAVPASLRSRRWLVLDVNESRANDHDYFKAIQHELDHGGHEAMLHGSCCIRDISSTNLRERAGHSRADPINAPVRSIRTPRGGSTACHAATCFAASSVWKINSTSGSTRSAPSYCSTAILNTAPRPPGAAPTQSRAFRALARHRRMHPVPPRAVWSSS